MQTKLEQIRKEAQNALEKLDKLDELSSFRIEYLGKKGKLTRILREWEVFLPRRGPNWAIGQ